MFLKKEDIFLRRELKGGNILTHGLIRLKTKKRCFGIPIFRIAIVITIVVIVQK